MVAKPLIAVASLLLAVLAAACFEPSYGTCAVECAASGACPGGLTCREDRFCHAATDGPLCGPCVPRSCDDVAGSCGSMPDGCGGVVECGDCAAPDTCGGGGAPNVCGDGPCTPEDPCGPGVCGSMPDGCDGVVECGGCEAPETCGGGGTPNQCGYCEPDCAEGELACGDDGCGGTCGSCPDERWTCHEAGLCCIQSGEQCTPLTEGCNCCPGLFCISGFCQPASGCALAPSRRVPPWERAPMSRAAVTR